MTISRKIGFQEFVEIGQTNDSPSATLTRSGGSNMSHLVWFGLFCFALLCFALRCGGTGRGDTGGTFALLCFALLCFAVRGNRAGGHWGNLPGRGPLPGFFILQSKNPSRQSLVREIRKNKNLNFVPEPS